MDKTNIDLILSRFDSVDTELKEMRADIKALNDFKSTWKGKLSVMAFVGTIVCTLLVSYVGKKMGWT